MTLTPEHQETLLKVARDSIAHGIKHGASPVIDPAAYDEVLRAIRASFVTLEIQDRLRGCIGALEATQPLVSDVSQHAHAAAFSDPRFPPLKESECPLLDIHISVLSPSSPVTFDSEADLVQQLRPGIDGLIIAKGPRRATFLPSVWASLVDPRDFLLHLKQKAGFASDESDYTARRYTTESFPEH